MESTVRSASSEQKKPLISTIIAAFLTDPVARWICPEAHQYFSRMDEFVDAFGGASFVHGSAYYVEGFRGAALWLPPKVQPNEETMMAVIKDVVPESGLENAFSVFEKMGSFHPDEPHRYLPLIGVDPSQQARVLRFNVDEACAATMRPREEARVPRIIQSTQSQPVHPARFRADRNYPGS